MISGYKCLLADENITLVVSDEGDRRDGIPAATAPGGYGGVGGKYPPEEGMGWKRSSSAQVY